MRDGRISLHRGVYHSLPGETGRGEYSRQRAAPAQTLSSDTAPLRGSKEASVAEGKTEGMAGEVGRGGLCRALRMVEGPGFLWNNMGTLQRVLGRREALIH